MKNRWLDGLTVGGETSLSLLARAQQGDSVALEALAGRYRARLRRWASGRIPPSARSLIDTDDLVQDAMLKTLRKLDGFVPKHDGALMAYLRQTVANCIRMELRRKRPGHEGDVDPDGLPSNAPSQLERVVGSDALSRYERALAQLDEDDRAAIVGRFELEYSYDALARATNRPSADAARKATERALRRLLALMNADGA